MTTPPIQAVDAAAEAETLPPLPDPAFPAIYAGLGRFKQRAGFTAEQMREYARAAMLAASPSLAAPVALSDERIDAIVEAMFPPGDGHHEAWLREIARPIARAIERECRGAAPGTAPREAKPLNGIPATDFHGEGAIARCSYCGRYSLDRRTLGEDRYQPVCECGEKHGWSGSFKRPGPDAKWSGATPIASPPVGGEAEAPTDADMDSAILTRKVTAAEDKWLHKAAKAAATVIAPGKFASAGHQAAPADSRCNHTVTSPQPK
jgi:hypothetical protein